MNKSGRGFDAVFHLFFLGVALVNVWLLCIRTQRTELLGEARAETGWSLLLLAVWLVPSVFYLRTWAGEATGTRLWLRAPLVQFAGILMAAVGAVAALLRLLGGILVLLAQRGIGVSITPATGDVTVGMLHSQLAWETFDALPLLAVTRTIGWEQPVPDPDWLLGFAGILGRVAVSVFVLWTFAYLVKRLQIALLPRPGSDAPAVPRGD